MGRQEFRRWIGTVGRGVQQLATSYRLIRRMCRLGSRRRVKGFLVLECRERGTAHLKKR